LFNHIEGCIGPIKMVTTARAAPQSLGSDFGGKRGGGSAVQVTSWKRKGGGELVHIFFSLIQMGPSGFGRWGLRDLQEKRARSAPSLPAAFTPPLERAFKWGCTVFGSHLWRYGSPASAV
jgi:hypothetical protein